MTYNAKLASLLTGPSVARVSLIVALGITTLIISRLDEYLGVLAAVCVASAIAWVVVRSLLIWLARALPPRMARAGFDILGAATVLIVVLALLPLYDGPDYGPLFLPGRGCPNCVVTGRSPFGISAADVSDKLRTSCTRESDSARAVCSFTIQDFSIFVHRRDRRRGFSNYEATLRTTLRLADGSLESIEAPLDYLEYCTDYSEPWNDVVRLDIAWLRADQLLTDLIPLSGGVRSSRHRRRSEPFAGDVYEMDQFTMAEVPNHAQSLTVVLEDVDERRVLSSTYHRQDSGGQGSPIWVIPRTIVAPRATLEIYILPEWLTGFAPVLYPFHNLTSVPAVILVILFLYGSSLSGPVLQFGSYCWHGLKAAITRAHRYTRLRSSPPRSGREL